MRYVEVSHNVLHYEVHNMTVRSGRLCEHTVSRADHAGSRDLHQKVGLDEVDISLGEGGTLFLPPSPTIAFRTPPHTRTPVTVCALRPNGGIMFTPVLHVLPLTIRSAYLPMIALLLRAFSEFDSVRTCYKPFVHKAFSQRTVAKFSSPAAR